ncbi:MAG: metal ABC transporter ATP-binding protein [Chloroflexi bacterium]|nr:metal ABC transporter ATP-binding protein [Chloroflexota bacterium]
MQTATALEVDNLTVGYNGQPVLSGVNLSVPVGAKVAIVGPNGAGKSTLFKGLVGLLPARTGRVLVHGRPVAQALDNVAYVPQREEVDWSFPVTALDVVLMGRYGRLGWLRRPSRQDRALARGLLDELGLGDLAGKPIGDLSGGQQQRLFLARALAQEPALLLMDEPFAAVDEPTQNAILDILTQLTQRRTTVLISTHDLELAFEQFDHLLLINHRVVAFGPPQTALNPRTLADTFGAPSFSLSEGRLLSLTNKCCPPIPENKPAHGGRQHG